MEPLNHIDAIWDRENREIINKIIDYLNGNIAIFKKINIDGISKDMIGEDFLVNTPWKNDVSDNVDLIWDEGNTMIGNNTQNNPTKTAALLTVNRYRTGSNLVWITQKVVNANVNGNLQTFNRLLQFDSLNDTILFKTDWKEQDAIKDGAIFNKMLDKNILSNTPWKSLETDDVNFIWSEGNTMLSSVVKNNPLKSNALLNVERYKTSSNNVLWVKQTIRNAITDNKCFERILQIDENTNSIMTSSDWVEINFIQKNQIDVLDYVKKEENLLLNVAESDIKRDVIFNKNGEEVVNTSWSSFKVPVEFGKTYTRKYTGISLTVIGFDKYGKMTENLTNDGSFTVSNINTTYVQYPVSKASEGKTTLVEGNIAYDSYGKTDSVVKFDGVPINEWKGKKWIALGTSMTMLETSYFNYVKTQLSLDGENRGFSSGGITTSAGAGNTTMQRIKEMEDFKGLLTVEIGPNDYFHPLGQAGDTTEDTFYGCLYTAFETLSKRTSARVVVMTMADQWANFENGQRTTRRSVKEQWEKYNNTRRERRNAILEMAEWFALPVIDVQAECGLGGYMQNNQTSYDWIHPTVLGGEIIGRYIVKQLNNRINPFPEALNMYDSVTV